MQVPRCVTVAAKRGIHPEMQTAPVVCNGEEVYSVTGTDKKYVVDLWSGNHPFYNGVKTTLVLDEGQVWPLPQPLSLCIWSRCPFAVVRQLE